MLRRKRHSPAEVASKLAQAQDLAAQGKLQAEIAQALGISVMTLHRWRKGQHGQGALLAAGFRPAVPAEDRRIAELQLENARLRRLVTDLLLEKVKLEEAAKGELSERRREAR